MEQNQRIQALGEASSLSDALGNVVEMFSKSSLPLTKRETQQENPSSHKGLHASVQPKRQKVELRARTNGYFKLRLGKDLAARDLIDDLELQPVFARRETL